PDPVAQFREPQQPFRLLQRLPRLHGDAAVEREIIQERLQIGRQTDATKCLHAVVDPRIVLRRIVDEMLVRIDSRRGARLHGVAHSSTIALMPPVSGFSHASNAPILASRGARWVMNASVSTCPASIARMTVSKSSRVALRLLSSVISFLWKSGSENVMLSRTRLTYTTLPPCAA